jgi:CMP-N-acetylneuraminic acid synthetase
MRVLGVVTARGGSKGIPRKNLRELAGKPLLAYTAEAALGARLLTDVVLSTDDDELATLGRRYGLQVPFRRPEELARDETPSLPVVQHAMHWMEEHGQFYDAVCLLQPTTPLRQSNHIDACIELLQEHQADSVITVLPVPAKYNPYWVFIPDEDECLRLTTGEVDPIPRRQELPLAFHREGSVYVTRRDVLMTQNSLYGQRLFGYRLEPDSCVNIDSLSDWNRAAEMLNDQNEGRDSLPESSQGCYSKKVLPSSL